MHNTNAALQMLSLFASVGAKVFDLSITDLNGEPIKGLQRPNRSLEELRRIIAGELQRAEQRRQNVIIRPRSATALLIQLDDFSEEKAAALAPYAFMTLHTSPGNYQVWLAASDGPKESDADAARTFRTRVRRGAGADHSATGATRIAGSLNFKAKYAPVFPLVTLGQVVAGKTVTAAQLERAGLIAREIPEPPASVPPPKLRTRAAVGRRWPDYHQVLSGAPLKPDGTPDRSMADFMFCKWAVERGWSVEETAARLMEVSAKAQERARQDDQGYAILTARNAGAAVARSRAVSAGKGPR